MIGTPECPGGSVRDAADAARQRLVNQYVLAAGKAGEAATTMQNAYNDASGKLSSLAGQVGQITDWFDYNGADIGYTFPQAFPGMSFDFSLNPPSCNGCVLPSTPDIPIGDGFDAIGEQSRAVLDQFQSQLDLATGNANFDASYAQSQLDGISFGGYTPDLYPDDYNPPPIDWTGEETVDPHKEKSDQFEEDAAISLDQLDAIEADDDANRNATSWGPLFGNVSATELVETVKDRAWFAYKDLKDASFTPDWLMGPIRNIGLLIEYLDVAYRLVKSFLILNRFWGRSALSVYPIDVTTDAESRSRAARRAAGGARGFALLLTHPATLLSFILLATYVGGAVTYAVYAPIYNAYRNECTRFVDGRPAGTGTVLAENSYSLAHNYASAPGNKLRLEGLDQFETMREADCARYGEGSRIEEERTYQQMDILVRSHTRNRADVLLMRECYDLAYLDNQFNTHPSGINDPSGDPYPVPSASVNEAACDIPLTNTTLENGVFDCAVLPDCELPCDELADCTESAEPGGEPYCEDNSELYAYVRTGACTAQYWFHANVLSTTFSIGIWFFLGMFRVIFLMGLFRVCWQFLNTGYFIFIGTTRADGSATYEKEDLADKVYDLLKRMRLVGALYMLLACLLQVPWVLMLLYFTNTISMSVLGVTEGGAR